MIECREVGKNTLARAAKVLGGLGGSVVRDACHSAMQRAAQTSSTKAGQFAASRYTINKGTFMSNVDVKIKTQGGQGGIAGVNVEFRGGVIPLLDYKTRYGRDGRVHTSVKRGSGGTINRAFVTGYFGRLGVFERVGKSRFPIEGKYGPSTAHMMQDEQVSEQMADTMEEVFDKRIEHEISWRLGKFGG